MMNVMMGMSGRCKKTVGQRFLQTWVKQEGQGPGLSVGKFLASRPAQSVETLLNQVLPAQNPQLFSFQAEIQSPRDSSASKFSGLLHNSTGLPIPLPVEEISVMNRNARRPKRANHGARPCSRSSRRFKKEKIGKRRRG